MQPQSLERRIGALELKRVIGKPAPKTDAEILANIATDYSGPAPTRQELIAMVHAHMLRPSAKAVYIPADDAMSPWERYMRMLDGPAD